MNLFITNDSFFYALLSLGSLFHAFFLSLFLSLSRSWTNELLNQQPPDKHLQSVERITNYKVDAKAMRTGIFPPMVPRCVSRGGRHESENGFHDPTFQAKRNGGGGFLGLGGGLGGGDNDAFDASAHSTGSFDGGTRGAFSVDGVGFSDKYDPNVGGPNRTGLRFQLLTFAEAPPFPAVGSIVNAYVAPLAISIDDAADWVRLPEFFQGCFDRRWTTGQVREGEGGRE